MSKKFKKIPKFKSEAEERKFWQTHDSTEYVDWSKAERVSFPNLKLTSKPITIRLPQSLIDRLKIKAHKRDVPYQSLMKDLLYKGLENIERWK
jgi:predicted DNA binding CopG/RHH family protein